MGQADVLLGLDEFDPVTTENEHRQGSAVPACFLDDRGNELLVVKSLAS